MKYNAVAASLLALLTVAPAAVFAQGPEPSSQAANANKATARDLTVQGFAALDKKDYATAAGLFAKAAALHHAPTVLLGLARANVGLGKLLTAQEAYSQIVNETLPPSAPDAFIHAVEDAKRELSALAGRVPGIIVRVTGAASPVVTIDGAEIPSVSLGVRRAIDPGRHVVKAMATGFADGEVTVDVAAGTTETAAIELKPGVGSELPRRAGSGAPSQGQGGSPWPKTVGFFGIGVGGAGLVAGGIMGIAALMKNSDLSSNCPGGVCPVGQASDLNTYHAMRTGAIATLIAGGVVGATGMVLVLAAPKPEDRAEITPAVGLGFVGLNGRF